MARRKAAPKTNDSSATLGFEAKLWAAADALRNNMDAAEYKHVVLGLIFLKYISDAFEARRAELEAERAQGADPEDPDEYCAAPPGNYARPGLDKQRLGQLINLVSDIALGTWNTSKQTSRRGGSDHDRRCWQVPPLQW